MQALGESPILHRNERDALDDFRACVDDFYEPDALIS